jgi:hypothetical protein
MGMVSMRRRTMGMMSMRRGTMGVASMGMESMRRGTMRRVSFRILFMLFTGIMIMRGTIGITGVIRRVMASWP